MNEGTYNRLVDLMEDGNWDEMCEILTEQDLIPEIFYVELANNNCKVCKSNQCNYCSIYGFDSKFVDTDILQEMGYLDENYNFNYYED